VRLRIHHGAEEIGGNCIELEHAGKTLLLDLGLPLEQGAKISLPDIPGLCGGDNPDLLGVVLSHPHIDHYGLLTLAHPTVPVWLGEGAKRLLSAAAPFLPNGELPQPITTYQANEPFDIGPFRITPYLMDHSAYDAHGLLIQAGGKHLFYTGDFRGHGRKAATFERFLANPPTAVDALIMEGTTLGRNEAFPTEAELEGQIEQVIAATPGLVLTCFSAQNVDRFVTFFKAALRSGRTFVVDAYAANMIDALGLVSLPAMTMHKSVRVFLPSSQKRMILRGERFDLIDRYRTNRIFADAIAATPEKFVMMFRTSMCRDLDGMDFGGGRIVYSLWSGYLDRDRIDLRDWARERQMDFDIIHTSGHAHRGDLSRMVESLAPRQLIPIHTNNPSEYDVFGAPVTAVPVRRQHQWHRFEVVN
tara:strand:+ start:1297 stop:2547 length:1251 start_codon:yes stop_codon:yes gene_type:complete